jgi:predicted TIM-barrel fold metal-dependent hydrolase
VRETIRWHPDPAKRWADKGILDTPAFRAGATHLAQAGLALDLLMNPWQSDEIVRLAQALPTLRIILNHCASPVDRDEAGIARWHAGLAAMAACENIAIKVSAFGSYATPAEMIAPCLDAFGPARAMFGTDYPVARRRMTYQAMLDAFTAATATYSPTEQRALFHDTARHWYAFPD